MSQMPENPRKLKGLTKIVARVSEQMDIQDIQVNQLAVEGQAAPDWRLVFTCDVMTTMDKTYIANMRKAGYYIHLAANGTQVEVDVHLTEQPKGEAFMAAMAMVDAKREQAAQ